MKETSSYKWFAFISVSVGVFMCTLDASILNIGLPTIKSDFHTSLPTVQWVVMAYLLAITSVLLTMGRLGDMTGRKRLFTSGIILFTVSSGICGFSPTIHTLIFARAFQGLGASMIMSMGPAILTSVFPSSERGRAMGMNGTVVAVGLTLGPAIGGYIIRYLGWRWMFFVNLPIGVVGLPLVVRLLRESEKAGRQKFDVPGASMLFVSLISALLALSYGREWGWSSKPTVLLSSSSALSGALFLWWESRTPNPVFHLELFRNRVFTSGALAAWISYVSLFAVSVYMPFYLRQVTGLSAVRTGQMLMLVPLSISFLAPISGWMSDRIGSRVPAFLGLCVATSGLIALSRLGVREPLGDIVWRLLLIGVGSGIFQSPNTSAIMGSVPRDRLGVASGMTAMMRTFGMVSGVAIIGAVISASHAASGGTAKAAMVSGIHAGFLTAAFICGIGALVSLARGSKG